MKRAACLILLAACGGEPPTVEDVYQRAIVTTCERAHECRASYPGSEADFALAYADSVEACIDRLSAAAERQVFDIAKSVEEGRIAFDADAADQCLDELDAMTCDELWTAEDPAACGTAFLGLVADGGECDIDLDCATPGSICAGDVCVVPD